MRVFVIAASLWVLVLLSGCAPLGALIPGLRTEPPIKIGVLHSITGAFSADGIAGDEGLKLYWDARDNAVAGRKVVLIYEDTGGTPDAALAKAKKLVQQDGVDLLVGPIANSEVMAVRDYVTENKVPMVLGFANARELTQEKSSPYIFRVNGGLQLAYGGGWYAAKKLNYRRAIIVSVDYTAGKDAAAGFKKYFEEAGGKVVSDIFIRLGATDVSGYLAQIRAQAASADVVVLPQVIGYSTLPLIEGLAASGLKLPLYSSGMTLDESMILTAPGDSALSIVSYSDWALGLDLPENKRFVADFRKKYNNREPGPQHLQGYLEGRVLGEALDAAKADVEEKDQLLAAIKQVRFESPRGPFRFDDKNQAVTSVFIRRVDKVGSKLQHVVIDRIDNVDQFWRAPN